MPIGEALSAAAGAIVLSELAENDAIERDEGALQIWFFATVVKQSWDVEWVD
jgi:hypothetical protein